MSDKTNIETDATWNPVRVVEESPVPWEELFGYMPEITDGLPVADYLEGIRGSLGCWLVRAIGGEQS